MRHSLRKCTVCIADLRYGNPKTNDQEVYINNCPTIIPVAYPYGIAFDPSEEEGIIDITGLNVEVESEIPLCKLHSYGICRAILFITVSYTRTDNGMMECLYGHLYEVEICAGVPHVTPIEHFPQIS